MQRRLRRQRLIKGLAIAAPIDTSGMALLTEALVDRGFTASEIAKIMGQNVLRVLRQVL